MQGEKRSEEESNRRVFQVNPRYNTVPLLLNGGHRALLIVEGSSNDGVQLVLQSLHGQTPYYTPDSTRAIPCISSENTSLSIKGGSSICAEVCGTLNSHWSGAGVESNSLTIYTKDLHKCQPHHSLPPPPSVTELQTVPESPPLTSSLNDSSLPLSVVTAPEGAGEGDEGSEADERVVRASDRSQDASGDSATTVSTPPTGQPGVVSTCFNMTQSLQSQCEGREKLTEESDEEIDMPAVEPFVNPSHLLLGIAPMSGVVDTDFQTVPPPLPQVTEVPSLLVPPTEPETPPLKRVRLCSDISQYKLVELKSGVGEVEGKEAEVEDGLVATESASDGSSTEDQAVPTECAREHGLVPSLAPCNEHWPQGGGGRGGGEGREQEVRREDYWSDGDEESLCPVRSGEMSSQQVDVSLEQQQVVPDGPVATSQMASSLYYQDDGSKCSPPYSVEGGYLDSLPSLRMRDQTRPSSGTGIHLTTCCRCNTRGMYAGCGP